MIKTGIVISIMNKKAGIMTSGGEFVYIKVSKSLTNTRKIRIGEIQTGELYKKNLFVYKYAIAVASIMFLFLSSGYAHFYYTPVTTVVLSINPSVSLEANRWNKILSSKALNSDGSLLLNNVKLRNKSIDSGLEILVKEAQTENFINAKYVNDKKIIIIDFKSNKDSSIDITNFKNIIDTKKLNIKISALSINNKTIDITVNNKKITTSTLNSISHKKEVINKQKIMKSTSMKSTSLKSTPVQKSSVDIYNNLINDRSSKTKEEYIKKSSPIINKENKKSNNINNSSTNKKSDVSNQTKMNREDTKTPNAEGNFKMNFNKFFKNFSN
ncbi:MAG TPA: hypothetical protein VIM70_17990 [Clostridium sp.]|uniref:anti-sigma-I factor RsgI family protein n=1 Tax=Clostridium sp. TaxID=1506 RepID=UPI002F952EFF